jgi:hypothetical protein
MPAVTLLRPVPLTEDPPAQPGQSPLVDSRLTAAAYNPPAPPPNLIQVQATGQPVPTLSPAVPPAGGSEAYNCGVANQAPDASPGFWAKCKEFFGEFPWFGKGGPFESNNLHHIFESDHEFDSFISPVSNPFFFEDPRSLTELRPIFIYQQTPTRNPIFRGGDIEYFGVQGRLALTERWSIVLNKFGGTWIEPHFPNGPPGGPQFSSDIAPHAGFSEILIGPKFTFLRNESTRTLGAVGLTFDFPAGDRQVLQDTGSFSLIPYVSMAQSFWKTTYGSMQAMGTIGYNVGLDNKRSDDLFFSLHLDYDIGNLQRIYPLVELNFFYYPTNGKANNLNFEGRDLFNFGSTSISGHTEVSLAAGARYKFTECIQIALVAEVPLTSNKDLMDYRITFDMIFRY